MSDIIELDDTHFLLKASVLPPIELPCTLDTTHNIMYIDAEYADDHKINSILQGSIKKCNSILLDNWEKWFDCNVPSIEEIEKLWIQPITQATTPAKYRLPYHATIQEPIQAADHSYWCVLQIDGILLHNNSFSLYFHIMNISELPPPPPPATSSQPCSPPAMNIKVKKPSSAIRTMEVAHLEIDEEEEEIHIITPIEKYNRTIEEYNKAHSETVRLLSVIHSMKKQYSYLPPYRRTEE